MFPIDLLWIYIAVPAVLVSVLILIKLWQEKMGKQVGNTFTREEERKEVKRSFEKEAAREASTEVKEIAKKTQTKPESSDRNRPNECPHYLGYLYMKKGPDSTYIPNECYGCRKLLQCLYSPNVIEKVYGE